MEWVFNEKSDGKGSNVVLDDEDSLLFRQASGIVNEIDVAYIGNERDIDEEFDIWVQGYHNLYLKLLGGAETGEIELGEDIRKLCGVIISAGYSIHESSQSILLILKNKGIITPESTYDSVIANYPLKNAIHKDLQLNLNKDPKTSRWGCGIVSDFDLSVNLGGDGKFNEQMGLLGVVKSTETYKVLKRNRTNLSNFLFKIREMIISNFDLLGTPDKKEQQQEKKSRKLKANKTPEDLEKEKNVQLTKASDVTLNVIIYIFYYNLFD